MKMSSNSTHRPPLETGARLAAPTGSELFDIGEKLLYYFARPMYWPHASCKRLVTSSLTTL